MTVVKRRLRGNNDMMKHYESGYNICCICKQWFSYGVWVSKYDSKMPNICESCEASMKKLEENT